MDGESNNSYMKSFSSTADSEWVAQNLQEVNQSVDSMLKIIQEDDESDSDEAYTNHQKRSQLTSLINAINHKHQLLGKKFEEQTVSTSLWQNQLESYENEMGLLKANLDSEKNWAVELQEKMENYTTYTTDSELETSKLIASLQNALRNSETEKAQLLSDNAVLSENMIHLEARYAEKELKIKSLENEIKKWEALNGEMKDLYQAKEMQWYNKEDFLKAEVDEKSRKIEALNKNFDGFKLKFDMLMAEKDGLYAKLQTLNAELCSKDIMIQQAESLKAELNKKSRNLEALNKTHDGLKLKFDMLMADKDGLNAKLQTLDAELCSKDIMIQQAESLKAEINEKSRNLEALNKTHDGLKLKFDMLTAEKDGLNAKLQTLNAELCSKDNMIQQTENQLHQLHLQNAELNATSGIVIKQKDELGLNFEGLKLKFDTLMAEKDGLNAKLQTLDAELCYKENMIKDRCEEKREAIRQLCISLEHYRNGYQELRKAYTGQCRRAMTAS